MCVCRLRYPVCNAHALYCHLWPVWLYRNSFFPHIISQTARFSAQKNILNIKCVFWFYEQLLSEMFFILRKIQRDVIKKNVYRPSCKVKRYFYQVLMKLWFSKIYFRETPKYKMSWKYKISRKYKISWKYKIPWKSVHWKPSCSIRTVGQTDGRTDLTNLIMTQ
jgi:hypothetical protein